MQQQSYIKKISFSSTLTTLVALLGTACEPNQESWQIDRSAEALSEIVNGTETLYEKWKGVLAIEYTDMNRNAMCTATLIDREVVLTAGHCVYEEDLNIDAVSEPRTLYFIGGRDIISSNKIPYMGATEVVAHPNWPPAIPGTAPRSDIALVKLEKPMSSEVEEYGVRGFPPLEKGETAKIVGYGKVSTSGPSGTQMVGDTTVLNVVSDLFEAGSPSGACMGDSGGPVFTDPDGDDSWDVTGVISFSTTVECESDRDTWNINLATYYDWIDQTMNEMVGRGLPALDTDPEVDSEVNDAGLEDAGPDDSGPTDAGDGDAGDYDADEEACDCRATGADGAHRLIDLLFLMKLVL